MKPLIRSTNGFSQTPRSAVCKLSAWVAVLAGAVWWAPLPQWWAKFAGVNAPYPLPNWVDTAGAAVCIAAIIAACWLIYDIDQASRIESLAAQICADELGHRDLSQVHAAVRTANRHVLSGRVWWPATPLDGDKSKQNTIEKNLEAKLELGNRVTFRWNPAKDLMEWKRTLKAETENIGKEEARANMVEALDKEFPPDETPIVRVNAWRDRKKGETKTSLAKIPTSISISYSAKTKDDDLWLLSATSTVERKTGTKYTPNLDATKNLLQLKERPTMPVSIEHPGGAAPPAAGTRLGIDAENKNVVWKLDSPKPHCLVVGGTGGGKTEGLDAICVDLLAAGHDVRICIPKRQGLPATRKHASATCIALSNSEGEPLSDKDIAEECETMINDVYQEMNKRNSIVGKCELAGEPSPAWPRIVLIVDEYAYLQELLMRGRTKSNIHPSLEQVKDLLSMGRSARISVLVATQTNYADTLGRDAQANIGVIIVLGRQTPEQYRMAVGAGINAARAAAVDDLPGRAAVLINSQVSEVQMFRAPGATAREKQQTQQIKTPPFLQLVPNE